ncbi:14-3-3 protein 7 [Artemisia annua]|uniref:14-3-3 protein 7 n=1 Tax=Artemisia annua TaxID=35608 RepID=A0A2U1PVW9_ARTAN|nr:14-3-3 protein 7 [Artemisia annua]
MEHILHGSAIKSQRNQCTNLGLTGLELQHKYDPNGRRDVVGQIISNKKLKKVSVDQKPTSLIEYELKNTRLQNNISNGTCKEAYINLTTTFNAQKIEDVLTKSNKMTSTREMPEIHAYHAKDIITIEDSEDEKNSEDDDVPSSKNFVLDDESEKHSALKVCPTKKRHGSNCEDDEALKPNTKKKTLFSSSDANLRITRLIIPKDYAKVLISLGSGPWDQLLGEGNSLAFTITTLAAIAIPRSSFIYVISYMGLIYCWSFMHLIITVHFGRLARKGDYYHNLAEFTSDADRQEATSQSLKTYEAAAAIAESDLLPSNPVILGLALNFSVFHYEIMGNTERTCNMAKHAFEDAAAELDSLDQKYIQGMLLYYDEKKRYIVKIKKTNELIPSFIYLIRTSAYK